MRSLPKWLPLSLITLVAGLVGVAGYWAEGKPPNVGRYYLRNSGGAVMLDHSSHIDMVEDCQDCHHDLLLADSRNECNDCHDDFAPEDFDHVDLQAVEAHACGTCHHLNMSAQAQSCRNCHPSAQAAEEVDRSCVECHDAEYTADLLTHDERREIHAEECESCHNPGVISVVYHHQCNRCHLIANAKLFAAPDNGPRCERCHLK